MSVDEAGPLPWRWCAPEALVFDSPEEMSLVSFSELTDVWAFGIVIFEIMSFGGV